MPTFFDIPDPDMTNVLTDILTDYHNELLNACVNVGIIVVRKEGKETESMPAFPPALARVKITSRKNRLHCEHDAIIEICHFRWNSLTLAGQKALIDHELTHLVPMVKDEEIVKDDLGRPRLKMRKDEIDLTAFTEVIARHGAEATDWKSISHAFQVATAAMAQRAPEVNSVFAGSPTPDNGSITTRPLNQEDVPSSIVAGPEIDPLPDEDEAPPARSSLVRSTFRL